MEFHHISVLKAEALDHLNIRENRNYVDATLGGAGHAKEILVRNSPKGLLLGIDRDPAALNVAHDRLAEFGSRAKLFHNTYDNLDECVKQAKLVGVDGILMDLGVSSFQLSDTSRGFSFLTDGPLDMRMGIGELTAANIVNNWSEAKIEECLRVYGEERRSRQIARYIVAQRSKKPFTTSKELADFIKQVVPASKKGIHPATLTFQGIRIAVNDEIQTLERALHKTFDLLNPGGRLVVISFHSLEDRVVKNYFNSLADKSKKNKYGPNATKSKIKIITKKPITPSPSEIKENPRSRSAKMRVFEKQ